MLLKGFGKPDHVRELVLVEAAMQLWRSVLAYKIEKILLLLAVQNLNVLKVFTTKLDCRTFHTCSMHVRTIHASEQYLCVHVRYGKIMH